jgi:hypothetical protein
MKNKYLIIISFISWCNISLFYFLYSNEIETVLIGAIRELTIIPSYLCGILLPVWLLVRILIAKYQSKP